MRIDVVKEIEAVGGYYNDPDLYHFVYKSGKHGCAYLNMDPLFPHVRQMRLICDELSYRFVGEFDAVVGAATGGIPLAAMVALERHVPIMAWADKVEGGKFAFERSGFAESLKDRQVLIVEDILNTGDTTRKLIALVRRAGGHVVGVGDACNRGDQTAGSLEVPRLVSLSKVDLAAYPPDICPGCRKKLAIVTDIGHGGDFQKANPTYEGGYRQLLAA